MFKNKFNLRNVILITVCLTATTLFSCAPQVTFIRSGQPFPPRADNDSVVVYHRIQDIPIDSERIGRIAFECTTTMITREPFDCNSETALSLAKERVNRAGGNALLITTLQEPTFWNQGRLTLKGDVFLVHDFSSPLNTARTDSRHQFYAGFGFGPETGISLMLPNLRYYNFQSRGNFYTYFGVGGNLNLIAALFGSLSFSYGVQRNIFTFDTSIGAWWYPRNRNPRAQEPVLGPYFHSTINPKIGLRFWRVWLRAGPSVHLYRNYRPRGVEPPGIVHLGRMGNMYFNFEILFGGNLF